MRKDEAVELIKNNRVTEWNAYRKAHPDWIPDLSNTDLSDYSLCPNNIPLNLSKANLCGTILPSNSGRFYTTSGDHIDLADAIINSKTIFPTNIKSADFGTILVSDTDPRAKAVPPMVFISYAWANSDTVLAIDQWLRLKNINTKLDKRDFFAGARIRDEIMRVMQNCDVALIFHSRQSKDKPWIQFETDFANDLEMNAKIEKKIPPRIIYVVLDDTSLPTVTEKQKIAVMAKGKRFELVCEEIYHHILQIPHSTGTIDLDKWKDFVF